jgi:hypothetical protein
VSFCSSINTKTVPKEERFQVFRSEAFFLFSGLFSQPVFSRACGMTIVCGAEDFMQIVLELSPFLCYIH